MNMIKSLPGSARQNRNGLASKGTDGNLDQDDMDVAFENFDDI